MPTTDERREVAARLRAIDDAEWCDVREELKSIDRAIGTAYGMPHALQTSWERLADLIEPEPERTCHVEGSYYDELMDEDYTDLSCGHHLRGAAWEFDFCYRCGAKVVQE